MTIDAYASAPNYLDHLAPIWHALHPSDRGVFYTGDITNADYAARRHNLAGLPVRPFPRTIDTLLVASYRDELAAAARRVVFVEHGAGQHYGGLPATNPNAAGRPAVALYLCPNQTLADRARPVYPAARIAVIGNPHLDPWHPPTWDTEGEFVKNLERRNPPNPPNPPHPGQGPHKKTAQNAIRPATFVENRPTIALAWHWDCTIVPEARTALPHYRRHLGRLVDAGFTVLGHAHPRAWLPLKLAATYRHLGIETVTDFADILDRAELLIADNTSALYEFASTGRPVVVLNAPYYRRDVHHGLRFWSEADVGLQVDEPEDLVATVELALTDPPAVRRRRQAIVETVYAHLDGNAATRAAEEVHRMLNTCPICGSPDKACGGAGHAGTEPTPVDIPTETTVLTAENMVVAYAYVGGGNTRIRVPRAEAERRGLVIVGEEPKARTAPNKARTAGTARNKAKTTASKSVSSNVTASK